MSANPTIRTTPANQFRSTFIYGVLNVMDNSTTGTQARAAFQRDVLVGSNLFLGNGALDEEGKFLDTTANLQITLNKEIVSIPAKCLNYIKNVTSDIQQQITDLSNNVHNNDGEQSSTFTNLTVTGAMNDLVLKNYGNNNTMISTGNQTISGNNNTRFGYFTGMLSGYSNAVYGDQSLQNCAGHSNTAIGHNSQNGNTSYDYNTSLGSDSNISGGGSNIAIGHGAQCSNCSDSVALGINVTCNTNNQILLGNSSHTVQVPGSINIEGKISQNIGNQNTAVGLLSFSSNYSGGYNSAFGFNCLSSNVAGAYCTAVGCNALQKSNAFGNTAIGFNAGVGNETGTYNTFLGYNANASQVVSNSTAIGVNASCNSSNQIMVGTSSETVVIPGNLSFLQNINNISSTTLGYLSGVTSSIQSQINNSNSNISTLQNKTTDMIWTAGQVNKTTIYNQCETSILSFSQSLNSISTTTFSYLSGVTSSIQSQLNSLQTQINALINSTPAGMVIAFAGSSSSLSGYILCDGSYYNSSNYNALFNAIGYTYGGENGNFRVPNYKGIFLRGLGTQDVAGKTYTAPDLGTTLVDKASSFETNVYVDNITTGTTKVVTGSTVSGLNGFHTANVIGNVNFSKSFNVYNYGNNENRPVHTSVQYFIKY